jgi:hypothetical protein
MPRTIKLAPKPAPLPVVKRGKMLRHPAADGGPIPGELPRPMICTPMYGQQASLTFVDSFAHLWLSLHASGLKAERQFMGNESLITRARNKMVAGFLDSKCTHLVFIDADIGFHPKHLAPMLKSGFDVVTGAYPRKGWGWANIQRAALDGAKPEELQNHGAMFAINPIMKDLQSGEVEIVEKHGGRFVRVSDASTGFFCISRKAIEAFISHYGKELEYRGDDDDERWAGKTLHNLFQATEDPSERGPMARDGLIRLARSTASPEQFTKEALKYRDEIKDADMQEQPPRYLSEDYWFCRKWQLMGGEVWLCLDAQLTHTGTYTWKGDVGLLMTDHAPEIKAAE